MADRTLIEEVRALEEKLADPQLPPSLRFLRREVAEIRRSIEGEGSRT
ncbi:MAG: hypothetical protein PHN90_05540 [Methanothrix sp.]|jgi:hypothetical protein|nr:hypothetical protein [Methanothrix sp.]MDI9398687.1 hypothetical protein [Euryarchaeota archaeon]